ncbi:MAG: OmpA/MotB family protein [Nocardioidaceae bacterium]
MARAGRRHGRREEDEEHGSHERWLVTYADMITLLMVLFIVLFAVSQVDQKKFNALKEGLATGFGQHDSVLDQSTSVLDNMGSQPMLSGQSSSSSSNQSAQTAQNSNPATVQQQQVNQAIGQAVSQAQQLQNQRIQAEAKAEAVRLDAARRKIEAALKAQGLADDVRIAIDDQGLRVSLVSKHIVFAPNLAGLTPRGREVLDVLSPVLSTLKNQLEIAGHTNQVPVKPKYYASDWDLSSARAITVLRYIARHADIPLARMHASAYGHTRPLVNPKLPGSQRLNRRVDILVLSTLTGEARSYLKAAAAALPPYHSNPTPPTDTGSVTP